MKKLFLILMFIPVLAHARIQVCDSIAFSKIYPHTVEGTTFSAKQLLIPGVLIAAGVYGTMDKQLDKKVRDQAVKWNGNTFIDNVFPAVAPASVYILNWCGVHGKHNFVDRTVIVGTAFVLTAGSTFLLKNIINTPRPDGDGHDAFSSLHTAVAFTGAEFLRREFKDKSIWYGVAGYAFATASGFFRIYNNRHWLSDVVAGAGIGILGTQAAYWLYPEIRKWYAGTKLDHAMILPFGNNRELGLNLSAKF
ncbi:MAG: phosphatase PAP2 family protein [Dysgonamonadaceae bacterium]|jgi:hypothetical protein|nr:phosphatase PAP2 family protein [Dysgonamonadaceae bacterium]